MDAMLERGFVPENTHDGFNHKTFGTVKAGEVYIIRFPKVTANKRSVNDIGWQIDGDAELFATLSDFPEGPDAIWQEILPDEGINKTASAVKLVGGASDSKVFLRIIMA